MDAYNKHDLEETRLDFIQRGTDWSLGTAVWQGVIFLWDIRQALRQMLKIQQEQHKKSARNQIRKLRRGK